MIVPHVFKWNEVGNLAVVFPMVLYIDIVVSDAQQPAIPVRALDKSAATIPWSKLASDHE